ncbi:MAG: hypothetical protein GTN71_07655 [Anaerolineae bacterium]|nr:hypothetical protein [Anaerolineae bacterium]
MTAEQTINQQEEFDLRAILLSKEIKFGVLGSIVGTLDWLACRERSTRSVALS